MFLLRRAGKLEAGETSEQAVVRELKEEFQLDVAPGDLHVFGTFYAEAAGSRNAGKQLRMITLRLFRSRGVVPSGPRPNTPSSGTFFDTAPEIAASIQHAISSQRVYEIANSNSDREHPNWAAIKSGIMYDICRQKLQQHSYIQEKLLQGVRD